MCEWVGQHTASFTLPLFFSSSFLWKSCTNIPFDPPLQSAHSCPGKQHSFDLNFTIELCNVPYEKITWRFFFLFNFGTNKYSFKPVSTKHIWPICWYADSRSEAADYSTRAGEAGDAHCRWSCPVFQRVAVKSKEESRIISLSTGMYFKEMTIIKSHY